MSEVHQKIVNEIVEKYKKQKSVVAITIFGSLARGEGRIGSDVDIEVISLKIKNYYLHQKKKKYGINIDLELINPKDFKKITKDYPYLWYDYYKRHKIIYDPKKIIKKVINYLEGYFKKNPEIIEFWESKLSSMKKAKKKGIKPENCYRIFDEAEIKFSKEHKVTRDFFRE